jgi:proline dehydrogenase
MLRRFWQSSMIKLARSARVKSLIQSSRATSSLARQYVAGRTPEEGVARAVQLFETFGIRSSLFYMGEYVDHSDLVEENVENKLRGAKALSETSIDIHISVDPTQIGYQISPEMARDAARQIATAIRVASEHRIGVNCLMFDMEDASLNDPTIALHNALQDQGYPVALTLQAYLKRTMADLKLQVARGPVIVSLPTSFIGIERCHETDAG